MSFRGSLPRLASATSVDIYNDSNIEYKSGAKYVGQVMDNKKYGSGKFTWPSGATYDGGFINNMRQGKGVATGEDGSCYHGDFHNDMRHGPGIQTWSNEESYEGEFFKDRRHGLGTYKWPDGSSFCGTFYMDKKEGYGKFSFPDGSVFEGLYKMDEREGPGVMTYPDKTQDVGIWRRENLVKLCLEVDKAFSMKDHPEFQYNPKNHMARIDLRDDNETTDTFKDLLNVPECFDFAKCDSNSLNNSVIYNDSLRPDSLAINKKSFDDAFFKDRKQNKAEDSDGAVLESLNTMPSVIEMHKHVYRHKHREKSVSFDVRAVLAGDRTGFGEHGRIELASLDLLDAASSGNYDKVQQLIDSELVHPDVSDKHGHSALLAASVTWHQKIMNYLLDNGANVNLLNDEGISCLAACHVFFYPIDSFKYNIAEQPVVFKSSVASNNSKRKVTGASTKFAKDSGEELKSSGKSIDSGFRTQDLTPVETVEAFDDESKPEGGNEGGDDEENGDNEDGDVQSNNAKDNQLTSTEIGSVKDDDTVTEITEFSEMEKEVSEEKPDGDALTETETQHQSLTTPGVDKDSLLLSDGLSIAASNMNDETNPNLEFDNENEVQNELEFQSNASIMSYQIEVTENLIDRCATQLSFNKFVTRMVRSCDTLSDVDEARARALKIADHLLMQGTIRLLLQRGANPDASTVPMPCLFFAIKAADVEAVALLLLKGASANAALPADRGGLAALHIAVGIPGEEGVQITELLLDALAHPDVQATEDESFLNKTLEDEWMKDSIDDLTKSRLGGRTPLHIACARDDNHKFACQVVHLLLDHHGNPNLLCNGHSPLSLAITSGNDLAIDELLAYGADPSLPLSHGIGSALCVASSTEYEHRRTPMGRIQLIDKLMKAGANILAPILIGPKRVQGTAVDFAYYMFNMDRRIAHMPYHALTPAERDTYNARRKLLGHLGDLLRVKAVERERQRLAEEEREGRRSVSPSQDFTYTGAGAVPPSGIIKKGAKPGDSKVCFKDGDEPQKSKHVTIVSSQGTPSASSQYKRKNKSPIRKPLLKYCYECGRSVGVRLAACSRCKEVYYCSKACKLKAWNARHKEECVRIGAKSRSPSPSQRGRVDSPTPATNPDGPITTVKKLTGDVNKLRIKVPLKGRSASAEKLSGLKGSGGRGGVKGSAGQRGLKSQSYGGSAGSKGKGLTKEQELALSGGNKSRYYPADENYSKE